VCFTFFVFKQTFMAAKSSCKSNNPRPVFVFLVFRSCLEFLLNLYFLVASQILLCANSEHLSFHKPPLLYIRLNYLYFLILSQLLKETRGF